MAKAVLWRSAAVILTAAAAGLALTACDTMDQGGYDPGYGPYGYPSGAPAYGYGPQAYSGGGGYPVDPNYANDQGSGYDQGYDPGYGQGYGPGYDQGYGQPGEVAYSPPPPLPIYDQPPIPAYGYIWTPGYWAWSRAVSDYYWTPGTWVLPPRPGLLWTPGFWQALGGAFSFNSGYWGPSVGFYGGVNYGFGYDGDGYEGGQWRGNRFFYNSTVNNVSNTNITNVYQKNVVQNNNYVSYNGGPGGVPVRPTVTQISAMRGPHLAPTAAQIQNRTAAMVRPDLRASVNNGLPAIAATARPGVFSGPGVITNVRAAMPYRPQVSAGRPAMRNFGRSGAEPGFQPAGANAPQTVLQNIPGQGRAAATTPDFTAAPMRNGAMAAPYAPNSSFQNGRYRGAPSQDPRFQGQGAEPPRFANPVFPTQRGGGPNFENQGYQNQRVQIAPPQNQRFQSPPVEGQRFANPNATQQMNRPAFQNPGYQTPRFQNAPAQNPEFQNRSSQAQRFQAPSFQAPSPTPGPMARAPVPMRASPPSPGPTQRPPPSRRPEATPRQ